MSVLCSVVKTAACAAVTVVVVTVVATVDVVTAVLVLVVLVELSAAIATVAYSAMIACTLSRMHAVVYSAVSAVLMMPSLLDVTVSSTVPSASHSVVVACEVVVLVP